MSYIIFLTNPLPLQDYPTKLVVSNYKVDPKSKVLLFV